jgi:hypothetical protein
LIGPPLLQIGLSRCQRKVENGGVQAPCNGVQLTDSDAFRATSHAKTGTNSEYQRVPRHWIELDFPAYAQVTENPSMVSST